MTADDKYSRRNMQNSNAIISKKAKILWLFIVILECAWNVEQLEKKDEYRSLTISEITESERGGYLNL